jgi:hypothetical protein
MGLEIYTKDLIVILKQRTQIKHKDYLHLKAMFVARCTPEAANNSVSEVFTGD